MFVGVVDLMEEPKRVSPRVPSVIWLRSLNHCLLQRGEVSNQPLPPASEALKGIVDWESRAVIRGSSPFQGKLPNQIIQSRPQGMAKLADQEAPFVGGSLRNGGCDEIITSVSVSINSDSVRVVFAHPFDAALKSVVMFTSPVESDPNQFERERWAHLVSSSNEY